MSGEEEEEAQEPEPEPEPAVVPAPEPVESEESDPPGPAVNEWVTLPNGKRGIRCTCGRIFSSGQALGGHRGKCKVPRERQRDKEARKKATQAGVPYAPPKAVAPKRTTTTRLRNKSGKRTLSGTVRRPVRDQLNADDYRLGEDEHLPQSLDCIIKVHTDASFRLPHSKLRRHRLDAISRFSYAVRCLCMLMVMLSFWLDVGRGCQQREDTWSRVVRC